MKAIATTAAPTLEVSGQDIIDHLTRLVRHQTDVHDLTVEEALASYSLTVKQLAEIRGTWCPIDHGVADKSAFREAGVFFFNNLMVIAGRGRADTVAELHLWSFTAVNVS